MQKQWRRLLAGVLTAAVCLTAPIFAVKADAANTWDAVAGTEWMAHIEGSKKITQINMPGTHDSATKYVNLSTYSKCQDTTIAEQLEDGVRFFDIRVELESDGKLKLVHGSQKCKTSSGSTLYLDSVLSDCYAFLDAHPTETIIMSVKKDNGDATDAEVQLAVHNYINENSAYWFLQNGKPTLDETRGKIVLARRYYDNNGYGDTSGGMNFLWGDQGGSTVVSDSYVRVAVTGLTGLWVQDRYEYSAADKWTAVKAGLDNPPDTSNAVNEYVLTFLSSAGTKKWGIPTTTPAKVAKSVNAEFSNYELTQGKEYGWIVMDYATEDLARKVFESNTYTE